MKNKKYTDGLGMKQFNILPEISYYNHNYYIGFEGDLLYGLSDDDNTTEWWIIKYLGFHYLGESTCSDDDKLTRHENRCT